MEPADFEIGQRVVDREDENPNIALVVNTPPIPADDWEVYGGPTTVADDNPDYPDDDPIVNTVFEEELPDDTDWDRTTYVPIADLTDLGTTIYTFPATRLTPLADEDDSPPKDTTTDDELPTPSPDLAALRTTLEDKNLTVDGGAEGETLVVTKLGQEYRIFPDGTVEGDGPHREPLQRVIADG